MRRMRNLLGLIVLVQLALAGCALTNSELKPPKPPEEFKSPPENDPRYSKPIEYPKETMEEDRLLKKAKDPSKNIPGPTQRPGAPNRYGTGF
jgi:hypothetical protein